MLNNTWNFTKRVIICSWKGHDYCKPYCFRCWKWFPSEFWKD